MLWIIRLWRTARVGLGEARSSRDVRVSPYASCTCPEQCVGELPSVVKRPAIEAREQRREGCTGGQKLQPRQLVRAECSVYVQLLALYARVNIGNHSAATRERFATDSETSAAAEQAANATTKPSGAQQVRTPPPKPQHTKQSNRSEERFSLTPRSRIRSNTFGEINLLLNLERSHTRDATPPRRAHTP